MEIPSYRFPCVLLYVHRDYQYRNYRQGSQCTSIGLLDELPSLLAATCESLSQQWSLALIVVPWLHRKPIGTIRDNSEYPIGRINDL
jgi:hypothetical protein